MDDTATILLIGTDEPLAERVDDVADAHRTRVVGDPAAAADAAAGDAALVVLDGRRGRAVDHLLETVRERTFEGPVLAVVEDPTDAPADVDETLVAPVDTADLRAAVEALLPNGRLAGEATVFEALGDHKGRRCCRALLEEPRGARDLAEVTGYSLPTVYRRLDALQSAGLVESSTRIRAGGGNYEVYRTVTTGFTVDIADGFHVHLERALDEREA